MVDIADNKVSVCPLDETVTTFLTVKPKRSGGTASGNSAGRRAKVFQRQYTDIDWLSGSLVLNNIPLSEAIEMINSYRAVPVVLLNNDKKDIIVDRVLHLSRLDEEVEEMMRSLGLTRESLRAQRLTAELPVRR